MSKATRIPHKKLSSPQLLGVFASFIARGSDRSNSSFVYSGGVVRIEFRQAITDSFKSYIFTFEIFTIVLLCFIGYHHCHQAYRAVGVSAAYHNSFDLSLQA